MQLVIDLDDSLIENLKKDFSTNNIKDVVYRLVKNYQYSKEYMIAMKLQQSIDDVKQNRTNPISKLLDEL